MKGKGKKWSESHPSQEFFKRCFHFYLRLGFYLCYHVFIFEICFKELASRLWGLAGPRSLGQADREIRLGTPGQGLKPQPTGRISFSSGMLSLFFKASNSYWFAQQQSDARQTQDRNILKCHDLQNFSDTNTFIIKT